MAPSAIPIRSVDKVYISTGAVDYPTPRAMTAEEIKKVRETTYRRSARAGEAPHSCSLRDAGSAFVVAARRGFRIRGRCATRVPHSCSLRDAGSAFVLAAQRWFRIVPSPLSPVTEQFRVATRTYCCNIRSLFSFPRCNARHGWIPQVTEQFRVAARNAIDAGFDGVEVHGANGYLLEQFIKVIKAVADEVGASRVGVRLSPYSTFLDETDSDPVGTYVGMVERLNGMGLAYVHFIEARVRGNDDMEVEKEAVWLGVVHFIKARVRGNGGMDTEETLEPFRKAFKGPFIAAGGFKRESGMAAIESGVADLITYGRLFLANPDLPRRFELNAPLNPYDRSTFFIPDQVKGYIDYPFLDEEPNKAE
ncbi:unnamed protein product [Closterium sp. Yama58-4]|nr:unnamed protein product [Closterium sp. Yama58-4]